MIFKTLIRKSFRWENVKFFSSDVNKKLFVEHLMNRSMLRIQGNEVEDYLQGLITNDMKHLKEGSPCMYAMFLNNKGRVLYDTIIYNSNEPNTYFIECDASAQELLKKHLMMYKVRRKIDVTSLEDELDVWNASSHDAVPKFDVKNDVKITQDALKAQISDCVVCSDPRIANLGLRILAPKKLDLISELRKVSNTEVVNTSFYKSLRYQLGVGEGTEELPPGNCFPLEANCDYLHGVSFHKGCYIGQELTARTHHTGVVRKRLMPVIFNEKVNFEGSDIPVLTENLSDKPIGKLKGAEGSVGIGLLRIQEALKATALMINDKLSKTERPSWWPTEAVK